MFFRADSVTLNTPHTTGKSYKIIFRTKMIIGTLPRIVGRGEIGPKSARLSCGVYPALACNILLFFFQCFLALPCHRVLILGQFTCF